MSLKKWFTRLFNRLGQPSESEELEIYLHDEFNIRIYKELDEGVYSETFEKPIFFFRGYNLILESIVTNILAPEWKKPLAVEKKLNEVITPMSDDQRICVLGFLYERLLHHKNQAPPHEAFDYIFEKIEKWFVKTLKENDRLIISRNDELGQLVNQDIFRTWGQREEPAWMQPTTWYKEKDIKEEYINNGKDYPRTSEEEFEQLFKNPKLIESVVKGMHALDVLTEGNEWKSSNVWRIKIIIEVLIHYQILEPMIPRKPKMQLFARYFKYNPDGDGLARKIPAYSKKQDSFYREANKVFRTLSSQS